jgi:hypothetical protein
MVGKQPILPTSCLIQEEKTAEKAQSGLSLALQRLR